MKIKSILVIAFIVQSAFYANAIIVQKIQLKNGSELEGYISMQQPGKNIVFTTDKATIIIPGNKVKSIVDHEINIKDLSKEWKTWADNHEEACITNGSNKTLALSDIITETGSISKVRILAKGADIKYIEMSPNSYSLNWDTISSVNIDKRAKTSLSGLNRVYQLNSGMEYDGEYVEEIPGKTVSVYEKNGVTEVMNVNDIRKYTIKKVNPNQSLFDQIPLYDIIVKKDGTKINGIIIEQNYGNRTEEAFLLIQKEDGSTQSVNLKDISEYRKEENLKYKPQEDVILNQGEIMINRNTAHSKAVNGKYGINYFSYIKSQLLEIKKPDNNDITVEENFMNKSQANNIYLLKINDGIADKKELKYKFTTDDVLYKNIKPSETTTSVNMTTKIIYTVNQTGTFVLFDSQNKTAIPMIIK
jgi:hypothetical protein